MDIFFSPYSLTPLKRANRMSSMDIKEGVYLKATHQGGHVFADYFPHLPLGDRSVDQFLTNFKNQSEEYDRKVLHLLLKDSEYQKKESEVFKNHQLWTGSEPIEAEVLKYKLQSPLDAVFLEALKRKLKVRLDGNGMFNRQSFLTFLNTIPLEYHKHIEYIEDPLYENDWANLPIQTAEDYIASNGSDYYIYKPNCEFFPVNKKQVIFSAYLGSDLGNWHTYCELMDMGEMSLTHGIVARGFYKEERGLFRGHYQEGMRPDLSVVKNIYQEMHLRKWKHLCTI